MIVTTMPLELVEEIKIERATSSLKQAEVPTMLMETYHSRISSGVFIERWLTGLLSFLLEIRATL